MLGAQTFSVIVLLLWGLLATYPIIWCVNKLIPIRLDPADEILGCDIIEHFMGDESEAMLAPLEKVQISNVKFGGPQVNFSISSIPYQANATYKEFNTLATRRPFHNNMGYERDENTPQQQTTERL
jgi:hypothetical protein